MLFRYKAGGFELELEGFQDPVGILKGVIKETSGMIPKSVSLETPVDAAAHGSSGKFEPQGISLDSFLAPLNPKSCRKIMEYAAQFIHKEEGADKFQKQHLSDTARSSKYFKKDWTTQVSISIKRMQDAGYLIELSDGSFRWCES